MFARDLWRRTDHICRISSLLPLFLSLRPTTVVMDQEQVTFNDTNLADANESQDSEEIQAKKRKERLEQNRISARESRKRKKSMIEELQRTVITLSRENKDLNERNETLRRQLMELASKVGRAIVVLLIAVNFSNYVCIPSLS